MAVTSQKSEERRVKTWYFLLWLPSPWVSSLSPLLRPQIVRATERFLFPGSGGHFCSWSSWPRSGAKLPAVAGPEILCHPLITPWFCPHFCALFEPAVSCQDPDWYTAETKFVYFKQKWKYGEGTFEVRGMRGGGRPELEKKQAARCRGLLWSRRDGMSAKVIQWEEPRPPTATAHIPINYSCALRPPTQELLGKDLVARVCTVHTQAESG